MKVLFITSQLPFPPDCGWNIRVFNFIRSLSDRHKITLLSFFTEKESSAHLSKLYEYCPEIFAVKRSSSYHPFDLARGLFTKIPFNIWNYRSKHMERKAKELLASEQFDVIQVEDIHMSQYLPTGFSGLKILDMHNVESQYMERFSKIERNILKKWYSSVTSGKLRAYEISHCGKFDVCLAVSENDKEAFQGFSMHRSVKVIPNGVDLSYFCSTGIETDTPTILFLGKLDYRPNMDALQYFITQIWPAVLRKIPEARFLVVGKNMPQNLENTLKSKNTIFRGYVADIREALSSCTAVVVPLRYGGGTRIKILEALAMEKPVVSTSLGSEGVEASHQKEILIADSPGYFAQCVIQLLNSTDLRRKLGRMGRRLVQGKYGWDKITQDLEKILLAGNK